MAHRWARRAAALELGVELRRRAEVQRRGQREGAVLLDRATRIEAVLTEAGLRTLVNLITGDMDPPARWTPRQSALIAVVLGRPAHEWAQDVSPYERGVLASLVAQWATEPERKRRADATSA